jgi:hypothetical protein
LRVRQIMKIIKPGHLYELDSFDGTNPQQLQFIEKENKTTFIEFYNGEGYNRDELVTVQDGTTNEEVIKVLIDRLQGLSKALPSRETSIAITKLEEALMWLEARIARRKAEGVYGTNKA